MFEDYLPIGSVVLLKNAVKKLMISGIKPITETQEPQAYDYVGVLYPEGYLGGETNFLFNKEDINDVVFRGYENPERIEFLATLEALYLENKKDEASVGEETL